MTTDDSATSRVRLDKWLWAARFFKTRSLATTAVNGGKVWLNEARVKPAHAVRPGETLSIRRGPYEYVVIVRALSEQRGPASQAALLYEETPASRERREALANELRLQAAGAPPSGRPTKKDRRHIIRFIRQE